MAEEDREEEACEDREKRDKHREKAGEGCEMFGSVVTQLPMSAPEERARLPQLPPAQCKQEHTSAALFPHAEPNQTLF